MMAPHEALMYVAELFYKTPSRRTKREKKITEEGICRAIELLRDDGLISRLTEDILVTELFQHTALTAKDIDHGEYWEGYAFPARFAGANGSFCNVKFKRIYDLYRADFCVLLAEVWSYKLERFLDEIRPNGLDATDCNHNHGGDCFDGVND